MGLIGTLGHSTFVPQGHGGGYISIYMIVMNILKNEHDIFKNASKLKELDPLVVKNIFLSKNYPNYA